MHIGVNALFLIPSEVGGTEVILIETLRAMRDQNPALTITIFTNLENHALLSRLSQKWGNFNLVLLKFKASNRVMRILREQIELPLAVRSRKLDLLWSPGYTGPILLSVPHVVSIPDVQYESHPEDLSFVARWVTHVIVKAVARQACAIIALSEFSKSEIIKYYQVCSQKIFVSYCGVNPSFLSPTKPKTLDPQLESLIDNKRPYLLCVANSYPHKNLNILVEAFQSLEDQIPHSLVLIGQPRLGEAAIRKASAGLQNLNRLIRINFVPHDDLPWIYKHADLFVFPSLYEGFGLPVLEAMSSGIPTIASRRASISEIGGDALDYVSGNDVNELENRIMATLQCDVKVRQQNIDKLKRRARDFTWIQSADRIVNAFNVVNDSKFRQ